MRIGFIARSLGRFRGGVDLYVEQLLRHLAPVARQAGHEVCALLDERAQAERFDGVPGELDVIPIRGVGRLLWDHIVTPCWCRARNLDVVVCPRSFRPLLLPCRSVTLIYDLMYFDLRSQLSWADQTYFRTLHGLSLHRSDAVITFSEFTASRIRALLPRVDPERIHILQPGPPHRAFMSGSAKSVDASSSRHPRPKSFLVVGALPRKNVRRVIDALARVRREEDASLVIASQWGRTRDELESHARELGVAEHVRFLGYVGLDELKELYRRATAFVYASTYEGIGIPPLEAMAMGCPVVAADATSIPEVVGEAALLVDPLDVASISEGMLRVLRDRELAAELTRKGNALVSALGWEDVARRTLSVLASAP